ncbi:hypothetical protein [Sporosarcina limicola]|uniref:Replication protein n=1 Tax=Sporosarcina limicola TaxID=34101 RepID=A0A927MIX5_9BACL|nr:hypothetical protein [Sporosarcina limicola]MBE1554773.1 hypothetical protein [Sporosarcina limicola]
MSEQISGGYILLSRKLIESEIWDKPPIYMKVWMYLLMKAQYKPYKDLERGQLIVSIPEIIEACSYKVGYRTEKPTKSQIFNILEWLRNSDEASNEGYAKETMIDTTKTTRGIVVNISNYNVYQDPKSYEQNDEWNDEESTNDTMPKRQANTINKKVKKELRTKEVITKEVITKEVITKEVIKDNVANAPSIASVDHENYFEEWWNLYSNKKDRKKCIAKYKILLKKYSHELMMIGTERYLEYRKDLLARNEFCPQQKHPSTFLNGENFNDEYKKPEGGGNNGINQRGNGSVTGTSYEDVPAAAERDRKAWGG